MSVVFEKADGLMSRGDHEVLILNKPGVRRPTAYGIMPVRRIIAQAERVFGHPASKLVGHERARPLVRARHAIMLVAYEIGWTSSHIGRVLNKRDHSTILHGRDQARMWLERDPDYLARVEVLREFAAQSPYADLIELPPEPEPEPKKKAIKTEDANEARFMRWCSQCDRRVTEGEIAACVSKWCALK